jgi:hypothetical protein
MKTLNERKQSKSMKWGRGGRDPEGKGVGRERGGRSGRREGDRLKRGWKRDN